MEETLTYYKNYFSFDLDVKKRIYDLSINGYLTSNEIIKYTDKLYDSIIIFQRQFVSICQMFNMNEDITLTVYNLLEKIKERIVNTNYTLEDVKNIYYDYFAIMHEKFLTEVRKNIYGDSMVYDESEAWILVDLLKECSSVNELLHFFHTYVTNNLDFLRQIPEIAHKKSLGDEITLRGVNSPLSQNIFLAFDSKIAVGLTDIVSINADKVLISVRDRGHDLQIEVEVKNDDEVGVYYFIPKVVISGMFSQLKGINKIDEGDTFATGSFVTTKDQVGKEIFDIVEKVPTDDDYIAYQRKKL